ncbi:PREDICTED: early nodulin [Prunus dulcis]|uniref:PREDICTED: early nodulin n=1 Tax=Prunus dulcis TaxID=3755 RepID=A0A5E4EU46_PRUDU|nr:mavicyanin-like [Prunus dulcis]KAI5336997.1 hypothetical protein L3X38_016266 [Prunus dulcis]VVA18660.1 PREDICTED: early nodulin [Prunus dulcis]
MKRNISYCFFGLFKTLLTVFLAVTICCAEAAATEFQVGDDLGWQEPDLNNSALYTQWASRNRFHVGDSLSFTYKNDSVLEVDKWDYYHCNTSNPIIAFDNGKSIMKLDRPGPFYFISGAPDHCKNGQRIFIEVMDPRPISQSPPPGAVPPEPYLSDSPAPSPSLGVAIAVAPCALFMALIVTFLASVCSSP